MSNIPEQSELGREFAQRSREQGITEGWQQGITEGRVDLMRALLRAKFGEIDDLDDLARHLAGHDRDGNIARIVAGATPAELRS
ncbi:hypothetical protein [Actinoplanes utahensis]|uniref:DUF4351 domain-containing protein n=1 Tax=Actinoplanes utahensis TaxID=1869 RepID=A0A0A6U9X5_ACTUT|nr:hypothetical protein [Actinoplanes utahensis]KHD72226.1 hypothetical protein MB27_42120 [Actinoplanes utahensis]GIF27507.1 hypothetical protein Aut01nite_04930 [Actinoplanes utahensis]